MEQQNDPTLYAIPLVVDFFSTRNNPNVIEKEQKRTKLDWYGDTFLSHTLEEIPLI